jgi:hypothetical protein
MRETRESPNTALVALTVEMMKPPIAASAQEAMHPETEGPPRKLVLVNQGPFHGYACSWCGCRFPEGDVPNRATLGEKLLLFEAEREKRFAQHVCSDRPHIAH